MPMITHSELFQLLMLIVAIIGLFINRSRCVYRANDKIKSGETKND